MPSIIKYTGADHERILTCEDLGLPDDGHGPYVWDHRTGHHLVIDDADAELKAKILAQPMFVEIDPNARDASTQSLDESAEALEPGEDDLDDDDAVDDH